MGLVRELLEEEGQQEPSGNGDGRSPLTPPGSGTQ